MAKPATTKARIKNETVIRRHSCISNYQDERYGPGNRVFNVGGKTTCTVCGKQ